YDYILWRMEEQGAYFFFAPDGDKIIFADSPQSHGAPSITVSYSPATGLEGEKREEVLTAFTMARTPLPRRVVVRTYDWKDPLKVVLGMADVAVGGMGDVYLTSENVESDAEAERIAKIRAEELICRSRQFSGAGAVPLLRPGLVFTLERHYNPAFNRGYMVTEITHEGGQEAFLSLGLGIPLRDAAEHLFYRNSFSCIEDDQPYRPARTAPRASIPGVIRAFVDGAGSGARAEMDEYGRYKLIFPFDVSGRKAGNASCWVRMAQPQVGMDHGMSFPLLPGAEVTVAFLNGNPDRPVITGALPNGETGAITGQGNVNFSGIRTPGGNQITFNDTDNKQGISLLSASGLGLSFADGSPNTTALTTDNMLSASGLASSDFSGACKTTLSGLKNSSVASDKWSKFWATLTTGIGSMATSMSKSLSSSAACDHSANGAAWGLDLVSALINIIPMSINWNDAINTKAKGSSYNASISGSTGKAASVMQVAQNTGKLAISLIGWFITRFASLGLDVAAVGVATTEANEKEDGKNGKEFYDGLDSKDGQKQSVQKAYDEAEFEYLKEKDLYDTAKIAYDNASDDEKKETINELYKKKEQKLTEAEQAFDTALQAYNNSKKTEKDEKAYSEAKVKYAKEKAKWEAIEKLYENPDKRSEKLEDLHKSEEKIYETAQNKYLGAKDLYDHASDKNESVEDAYTEFQDYQKDYRSLNIQAAIRKAGIQQLSTLLTDITAFCVLCNGLSEQKEEQLGGISLSSSDKNINLDATKTISMHSGKGIFLNTDRDDNSGAWGINASQDYKIGSTKISNDAIAGAAFNTDQAKGFVAVKTTNRYVEAEKNEERYNTSTITVDNRQTIQHKTNYTDAQPTASFSLQNEEINLMGKTIKLSDAAQNPASTLELTNDKLNITTHGSTALLNSSGITLGRNNNNLEIKDEQLLLKKANSSRIEINDDITLRGGNGNVHINDLTFNASTIKSKHTPLLEINGKIKVLG
ncbi:MAG: type VI secretion system tip protein VgrG, partial [bacterium]|nr:type VI secretion system tip protein VgrG [bacterium]